jgi:hypothetical protein
LTAGCIATPQRTPISEEPILSPFYLGQPKDEVLTVFESLGFGDDRLDWSSRTNGSEILVFSFIFQKGTAPPENLGTFELLFSPEGTIQSGRKRKEKHEPSTAR